jgi:hypothetical protein
VFSISLAIRYLSSKYFIEEGTSKSREVSSEDIFIFSSIKKD